MMTAKQQIPEDRLVRLARDFVRDHGQAALQLVGDKEREVLAGDYVEGASICRRLRVEIERLLAMQPESSAVH